MKFRLDRDEREREGDRKVNTPLKKYFLVWSAQEKRNLNFVCLRSCAVLMGLKPSGKTDLRIFPEYDGFINRTGFLTPVCSPQCLDFKKHNKEMVE